MDFLGKTMPINTDFIHPKDAPTLLAASQQTFLLENATLNVRAFDNAVIYPNDQHGGLYVNNAPILAQNNSTAIPSPRKLIRMKQSFM